MHYIGRVPDEATGKKLAHALLDNKLVACVNILPGVPIIVTRWTERCWSVVSTHCAVG